jgi:hypothetical protein
MPVLNGPVELNDGLDLLKQVVGLTGLGTPAPEWRFADEASAAQAASPGDAALTRRRT